MQRINYLKKRKVDRSDEVFGHRAWSIRLGTLILAVSIVFFVLTSVVTIAMSVYIRSRAIDDLAREDARQTSRLIFQSLYSAMRKGWTKNEISEIIERLNQTEPNLQISVFRGDPVIRQFGEIPGEKFIRNNDPAIATALKNGKEVLIPLQNEIRYVYPIVVKNECIACHTMAKPGDINGVIDINYPINNLQKSLTKLIVVLLGIFMGIMMLLFAALYLKFHFFLLQPIQHFLLVIRNIIQNTDLTQRVRQTSVISEFRKLTEYFNRLLATIHSYQVQLEELTVRDPLTGAYNRRKFEQFLEYEIDRSRRHDHSFSLVMLDIDNFKHVNDTYGHPVGDLALKELAMTLASNKRKSDILARLSGDEFALILPETPLEDGIKAADDILKQLKETSLELPTGYTRVHASIGVVSYPQNGEDTDKLRIAMDVAMYKAKKQGKNQVAIIEETDAEVMMEVFKQGEFLRNAMDNDRIIAYFQPLVKVSSGEVFAYEVLARILDNEGKVIPAIEFIHIAEELGYAEDLDRLIMRKGLEMMKRNNLRGIKLFFNFSSRSFGNLSRIRNLPDLVYEYKLDPGDIVIEITEREALPHIAELAPLIDELHVHGIKIALDDFGSGFSSFMYLKYLPVDYVKIEGSFIKHMAEDTRDLIMVRNMHQMAHEFGLETIAEYVEDEATNKLLKSIGIDYGQGYLYGTPEIDPALSPR